MLNAYFTMEIKALTQNEKFERYKISKKYAPNKFNLPPRFDPKISKIGLLKIIINEFDHLIIRYLISEIKQILQKDYILKVLKKEEKIKNKFIDIYKNLKIRYKALFDRPCEYGVFSGILGGFLPKKEKCTGCLRCWQEYPNVAKIYINKDYLKFEKSLEYLGLKLNEYNMLLYEAETGEELVKGMGYKGPFAGSFWDGIWLDMSEIVRPTRDGKEGREYISTTVDIGRKVSFFDGKAKNNCFTIKIPVFFDFMENFDYKIQKSIAIASKKCSTFFITNSKFYYQLKDYNPVPLVNIDDEEIIKEAKIIEVEFSNLNDIIKLREKYPNKILIVRLKADENLEENSIKLCHSKVDSIHVKFSIQGFDENGNNAKYVIRKLHNRLLKEGIRNEISILGSGGIYLAEHVVKSMICGLDCVGIDIVVNLVLQSKIEYENGLKIKNRKINIEWASQRLINLLSAWHEQIIEALSAMGKRDVRRLRGDVGRAIFYEEIRNEAFADIKKAF